MSDLIDSVVEPFVRRGLFQNAQQAVSEMAREYTLRQVEHYHSILQSLETKYGMSYERFSQYLQSRSATLAAQPNPALNQAVMEEEEDAFEWKTAQEMLSSWLGLQNEVEG